MNNGMQRLEIHLVSGRAIVTNPVEFVTKMVAHEVVHRDEITVVKPPSDPELCRAAYGSALNVMDIIHSPLDAVYEKKEVRLQKIGDFNAHLLSQFYTMLTKKPIEFNVPNLKIDDIHEMANKYCEQFGHDGAIVLSKINPYLNLVSLIDFETLKIYRNHDHSRAQLVEIRENRWVVGKFDSEMEMFKKIYDAPRVYRG